MLFRSRMFFTALARASESFWLSSLEPSGDAYLDICFYAQQRVSEDDKNNLYNMIENYYLHSACAFIGINASGKTSVLKVVNLALSIIKNEPINHAETKSILGGAKKATICTYFYDKRKYVCCLETALLVRQEGCHTFVLQFADDAGSHVNHFLIFVSQFFVDDP